MKTKHRKMLAAIYEVPTRAGVVFSNVEGLLRGLGAALTEREGSRVNFTLRGVEWHAHRPHLGKEAKKYQVESAREFLERLEIRQ